jgi:hypothetical protein
LKAVNWWCPASWNTTLRWKYGKEFCLGYNSPDMNSGHRQILTLMALAFSSSAQPSDFVLTEHLGHTWINERVVFTLEPDQAVQATHNRVLLGPGNQEIPYQLQTAPDQIGEQIVFQTDLAAFDKLSFRFSENAEARDSNTDLIIQQSTSEIRIENDVVGLAIRKELGRGQGPISAIRLRSGAWSGGSSLSQTSRVKNYSAQIIAHGPVFVEVECRLEF